MSQLAFHGDRASERSTTPDTVPESPGRRRTTTPLRLLVSTLMLGLLLWRTPLADVREHLQALHLMTLLVCAILALISWMLSALRLWCLLPALPLATVLRNTFASMLYATVLPGPIAGDFVKAFRLGKTVTQRGHAEAATFVDRGIALFALFCMSAVAAPMSARMPPLLRVFFIAGTVIMAAGGLVLASQSFRRLVEADRRATAGPARTFLRHFAIAMHDCLRRPSRMVLAFFLALAFHALCVLIQVLLGDELRISLGWIEWIAIYSGVSLVTLAPISIAGVGLREGGFVGFLSLFGVAGSAAMSLSFATFALTLFGAACGGLVEARDALRIRGAATAAGAGDTSD